MSTSRIDHRPLLVIGGLLIFVGGAMHGDPAAQDLPIRQNLATTMAAGGWVLGHSIMAVGALALVGGVVASRRDAPWPLTDLLWKVAIAAALANFVELVIHTTVIVDQDRLAAGETGAVTAVHLVGLLTTYPLYGLTVAVLAWRLAGSWPSGFRVISAIGIVGGVCHAFSAPLAIVTENSAFEFLFPLAGITVSIWWVVVGAFELRTASPARRIIGAA